MSDADLPVFSFRPNWREPVIERLAFSTDVLGTPRGVEQRRSLRSTPRRLWEAEFLLVGPERTFWDLLMNAAGGQEMTVPLYWEVVVLAATSGDRIDFDTRLREWTYHAGLYAILLGKSALDYEVVQIETVDDDGVTLAAPLSRTWPQGTRMYPLRRAVIEDISGFPHASAAVATTTAQFRIIGPNPWQPAADASPTYGGLPVMLQEPNWVDDLEVSQDREIDLLDPQTGLSYQIDATGRALLGQSHRWFLPGREKLAAFRDMVYRHRGRAGVFWLPSFKADLNLKAAVAATATQITVENVGYRYSGGPVSGREHIAIRHAGGTILRRVLSVVAGTTPATERLNLDSAVGLALQPGQVRKISFMDTARFDTDEFEITHYGGVDAHHDSSALFRNIRNTRTSPTPIHLPPPIGVLGTEPCGVGRPVFEGWYVRIRTTRSIATYNRAEMVYWFYGEDGGTRADLSFLEFNGLGRAVFEFSVIDPDVMDSVEMGVRYQHFRPVGGGGGDPGTITTEIRFWTEPDYRLLTTKQSEFHNPGANSDQANGLTAVDFPNHFPRFYFFDPLEGF